jgi:hypothetical protein
VDRKSGTFQLPFQPNVPWKSRTFKLTHSQNSKFFDIINVLPLLPLIQIIVQLQVRTMKIGAAFLVHCEGGSP